MGSDNRIWFVKFSLYLFADKASGVRKISLSKDIVRSALPSAAGFDQIDAGSTQIVNGRFNSHSNFDARSLSNGPLSIRRQLRVQVCYGCAQLTQLTHIIRTRLGNLF